MKEHELVSTILGRLSTLLSQVPSVCSVDPQPEALGGEAGRADGILAVSLEGSTVHTLVVEAKGNAQPRNVRDAARRLTTLVEELRSGGVPHPSAILGAPYVSERSAAVLAEHGVGHLDLAGNARLAFGPVYVELVRSRQSPRRRPPVQLALRAEDLARRPCPPGPPLPRLAPPRTGRRGRRQPRPRRQSQGLAPQRRVCPRLARRPRPRRP